MNSIRALILPLAFLLITSPQGLAVAQGAKKPDKALLKAMKAKLAEGKKLLDGGEFEKALAVFQEGYETYQDPEFILWTGHSLRKLKRYEETRKLYEEYLAKNPKTKNKREFEKIIEEISDLLQTHILVKTSPPGAKLWLDTQVDASLGVAPFEGNILPGPHIFIAELSGYATARTPFTVEGGKTNEIEIKLSEGFSPIQVETNPPGARIFIDDKEVGLSPYKGEVSPGAHKLRIEKEGSSTVELAFEAHLAEPLSFSPVLPLPPAVLSLSCDVPGAEFSLDEIKKGPLPARLELAEGEHVIAVEAPGYRAFTKRITVSLGDNITLPVELRGEGIFLLVNSNLEGARILLDGSEVATTPSASPLFLPKGKKATIEISKEGYLPFRKALNVEEDGDFTLKVRLIEPRGHFLSLTAFGLAAGGGIFGGVFGFLALKDDREFEETPTRPLLDKIEREARLANIGGGVAGAALVGGVLLLRREGGIHSLSPGRLSPTVGVSGTGVTAVVSF